MREVQGKCILAGKAALKKTESRTISLSQLSSLMGLPSSVIKKELSIDQDEFSLEEFRTIAAEYLDICYKEGRLRKG